MKRESAERRDIWCAGACGLGLRLTLLQQRTLRDGAGGAASAPARPPHTDQAGLLPPPSWLEPAAAAQLLGRENITPAYPALNVNAVTRKQRACK